jgi:Apea-like HEPN
MENITLAVGAEKTDPHELAQWVWNHFNGQLSSSEREMVICKDSIGIVRVEFSKRGQLIALKLADATPEKIAAIRDAINVDLLKTAGDKVVREVLFSSFPVDGFFRFKDKLQIRPIPAESPKPPSRSFGEQPFLLEFRISESRNVFVTSIRRAREIRLLGATLAALLEGVITVNSHVMRSHWVNVPVNGPGEPLKLESRCLAGQYIWPGLNAPSNDFSSVQEFPAIAQITGQTYYMRGRQLVGRSLEIPDTLGKLLSTFFSLPPEEERKFVRAAYWFSQAKSAYLNSKSYQYIALVMAIETLANDRSSAKKCPKCRRDLGNGPTRAFQQFLERYTPDFENGRALKRELYTLRCRLSHGSHLLLEDMDSPLIPLAPMAVEEMNRGDLMYNLVRIALVNWLTSRSEA